MTGGVLRIFIGYDEREAMAYHVLAHSLLRRASRPLALVPLARPLLRHLHQRPRGLLDSTDFSITRFLVPALCEYRGYAVFLDCDMLCQADIGDILLYPLADPGRAVYVCQHDYTPKTATKFLGASQRSYQIGRAHV